MPDGKICYLEIPAINIEISAKFFTTVFGWKVRVRGDGARAFDDTMGAVSGTWGLGRPPSRESGVLIYVMVERIEATLRKVLQAWGKIGAPFTPIAGGPEAFATFLDPADNSFGLYQERQPAQPSN